MDCFTCSRFHHRFQCQHCTRLDVHKYRAEKARWDHEKEILEDRILTLWPREVYKLQDRISRLKQSIHSIKDMSQQFPQSIMQAKERISQLKLIIQTKRSQLNPLQAQLQIVSAQGASQHNARQLKLRDNDRLVQKRLHHTRRLLLASLGELGQPNLSPDSIERTKDGDCHSDSQRASASHRSKNPSTFLHSAPLLLSNDKNISRRTTRDSNTQLNNIENLRGYVGGLIHALHVTALASRYLGVSLPFDLQRREPLQTFYLFQGHLQYQHLSNQALFELEAKKEHQALLIAMISYNTLYLQHLQSSNGGLTTKSASGLHLAGSPANLAGLVGPAGLDKFLNGCRTNSFARNLASLSGPGFDSAFNIDFYTILNAVRGGLPSQNKHQVHDNYFAADDVTHSVFRDEDYDLALSKSQLPPAEQLTSYHFEKIDHVSVHSENEEESWESVDVVLPPTPSELEAIGI